MSRSLSDAQLVKVAKALADPTRVRMLRELREAGPITCSEACEKFPLSQPTISHHVKTLVEAGLIRVHKRGPFRVLEANGELLAAFAASVTDGKPPVRRRRTVTAR